MKPPYIKLYVKDFSFDISTMSDKQLGSYVREFLTSYKTEQIPEKYKENSIFLSLFHSFESYRLICKRNKENRTKSITYTDQSLTSRSPVVDQNTTSLVKPITNNQEPEYNTPNTSPHEKDDENAKPKRTRKKSSYINEEFRGDIRSIKLAAELGIDFEREQQKFINYWLSNGKQKADWQATFRNWITRASEFSAERKQGELAKRQDVRDVTGAALRAAENLRKKGWS